MSSSFSEVDVMSTTKASFAPRTVARIGRSGCCRWMNRLFGHSGIAAGWCPPATCRSAGDFEEVAAHQHRAGLPTTSCQVCGIRAVFGARRGAIVTLYALLSSW